MQPAPADTTRSLALDERTTMNDALEAFATAVRELESANDEAEKKHEEEQHGRREEVAAVGRLAH